MTSISLTREIKTFPRLTYHLVAWEKKYGDGDKKLQTQEIREIFKEHSYKPFVELRDNPDIRSDVLLDIIRELPSEDQKVLRLYFRDQRKYLDQKNEKYAYDISFNINGALTAPKGHPLSSDNYLFFNHDSISDNTISLSRMGLPLTRWMTKIPILNNWAGRMLRIVVLDHYTKNNTLIAHRLARGAFCTTKENVDFQPNFYWDKELLMLNAEPKFLDGNDFRIAEYSSYHATRLNQMAFISDSLFEDSIRKNSILFNDGLLYFRTSTFAILNDLLGKDKETAYSKDNPSGTDSDLNFYLASMHYRDKDQHKLTAYYMLSNIMLYQSLWGVFKYITSNRTTMEPLSFRLAKGVQVGLPHTMTYASSDGFFVNNTLPLMNPGNIQNSLFLSYGFTGESYFKKHPVKRIGLKYCLDEFPVKGQLYYYKTFGEEESKGSTYGINLSVPIFKYLAVNAGIGYNNNDYVNTKIKHLPDDSVFGTFGVTLRFKDY